jgi:uncharacterized membrane protein
MLFAEKLTPLTRTLILLALLGALLSFAKFDHCRSSGWVTPDNYVHACYSDIPSLYSARGLDHHAWSYSSAGNAVEYPVVTGVVMWATSWLTPAGKNPTRNFFDVNALLIALLFVGIVLIVGRIRPQFAYLLPLSPAVIASLYINWDLWGIVSMMLAIYYFDRRKLTASSVLLGVSIATKFFPVLLLMPIIFILWRRNELRNIGKYLFTVITIWLAINLPVLLTTPQGWWRFYKLNLDRQSEWGSLWYAMSLLGVQISHLNYITVLSLVIVFIAMLIYLLELSTMPTLANVSFILMAAVLCVGKVYSPQYVLWLTPLAVISLRSKRSIFGFWVWQAGEAIYHLAIWQHLALTEGSRFGLPAGGYALVSLIRVASTLFFIGILVQSSLKNRAPQAEKGGKALADFLLGTADSYP